MRMTYRLSADRQIRLYTDITRRMVKLASKGLDPVASLGIALQSIRNVQDAIARLQEHHVR